MTSNDELATLLYQLQEEIARLKAASQLSSSTVGTDAETAVAVDDVVTDAAMTTDALPGMQDDTADSNQGVVDLQTYLSTVSDDLDARFELKDQELADATEDLAASQQEITDAFGQRIDGLSDRVDEIVAGAGGTLILFSDDEPDGTAPTGSTWFMINEAENIVGQWQQTGTEDAPVWTPREIESTVIANLDVAKLTAGQAALAQVVAQKIAASTASIQTVNVGNLFVTDGATMAQAVINYLFANVVQAKKITADMIDVNSLSGITLTGATIKTAASGQHVELSGTTMRFYDPNGTYVAGAISDTVGVLRLFSQASNGTIQIGKTTVNGIPGTFDLQINGTTYIPDARVDALRVALFPNDVILTSDGTGPKLVARTFATNTGQNVISANGGSPLVTATDFQDYGTGASIRPSKNYVELTATAKISDSTAAFVTGWAVDNTLTTNAGMVSISGNAVTLAVAGVYTVDTVSQTPATSATLANRNYLQLQTGSTMDDGRVNRVMTRSENLIQGSATFAVVAGQAIRVVAYHTTGADRNMSFSLRITRHG